MKRPTFVEIMSWVLIVMVVIIVMFSLIGIMIDLRPTVQYNMIEKSAAEISENLLGSGLTDSYAVFDSEKLSAVNNKNIEPVRDCRFGYEVSFRCLDKDECKNLDNNGKYKFGYKKSSDPARMITGESSIASNEYFAGIKSSGTIIPAKMTVDIYDTALTRTACLIEKAYSLRQTQEAYCLKFKKDGSCVHPLSVEKDVASLAKNNDQLCNVLDEKKRQYEYGECKYLPDVEYLDFIVIWDQLSKDEYNKISNAKKIKAVPLKKGSMITNVLCKSISPDVIANERDADIIVALCVE